MRITPGILSVWDAGLEDSYEYLTSLSLFLPLSLAGETCVRWPGLVAHSNHGKILTKSGGYRGR